MAAPRITQEKFGRGRALSVGRRFSTSARTSSVAAGLGFTTVDPPAL